MRRGHLLFHVALLGLVAAAPGVKVVDSAGKIDLDNGLIGLTINKETAEANSIRVHADGDVVELGNGANAVYFDCNTDPSPVKGNTYYHPFSTGNTAIGQASGRSAEVVARREAGGGVPLDFEMHYLLRGGDSGFYMYVVVRHKAGMPAVNFIQDRVVVRAPAGPGLITDDFVDERHKGPFEAGAPGEMIQDATWQYADGKILTKYDNTAFIADDLIYGMSGHGFGIWLIQPSREYVNGGPLRQELTVQYQGGNLFQWMLQGEHFGGPAINLQADQEWSRFYGPAFIYVNHSPTRGNSSNEVLWKDAKDRAHIEDAKWPYAFINSADYPLKRGTVSGQIKLADGGSTRGAWCALCPPGSEDWSQSSIGYMFWTRADADGRFTISKIRPGKYRLVVCGADQFEVYQKQDITVNSDETRDLGTLTWTPITHGRRLWQIGIADRSTAEFKHGDDVRHYANFLQYAHDFPDDVTFTIGQSREDRDWNFAQWGWYVKRPQWRIRFRQDSQLQGRATLTLGFAAWNFSRGLDVKINGHPVGTVTLQKSGTAGYRSGGQDSRYQVAVLSFDAAEIVAGDNDLTLELQGSTPIANAPTTRPAIVGDVMYDAIRLEVE